MVQEDLWVPHVDEVPNSKPSRLVMTEDNLEILLGEDTEEVRTKASIEAVL